MKDKIVITGGTGFVGGHLIAHLLMTTDYEVLSVERNPVKPRLAMGALVQSERVIRVCYDLRASLTDHVVKQLLGAKFIVHAGAEVSGITSLQSPVTTVTTNAIGTYHMLELARRVQPERFVYVSSSEAVGAVAAPLVLDENAPLRPSNPYAASKAAGEELCRAYYYSFGVPAVVVRTMNLFGPYQGVERFVPMVMNKMFNREEVVCHVGPDGQSGSRNWLPVESFVNDLAYLTESGIPGETYHVVGPERTNLQVIQTLAKAICNGGDISLPEIKKVVPGPSHDMRYALTSSKVPKFYDDLDTELSRTARWYVGYREHVT